MVDDNSNNKDATITVPTEMLWRTLTTLSDRRNIANRAGLTFGGDRDLYIVLGYRDKLTIKDYRDCFKRNGIAARIVTAYPDATWRYGAGLVEDDNPEKITKFEQEWAELEDRLQVWSVLRRADILAGLGRYAIVLLGLPGELDQPVDQSFKIDALEYMTPFDEDDARISTLDEDTTSKRFGKPTSYTLKRVGATGTKTTLGKPVHYTRVLHIADGMLDDEVYGTPRLEKIWNRLDDLEKVVGGGSESFWLRANQGLHLDIDKDVKITEGDIESMREKAENLVHKLTRTLGTRGVKAKMFGSDVANFKSPVDTILSLISGATGIPLRILLGSERGELASTQDKTNWDERIGDRRTQYAGPHIIRPFVQFLIDHKALTKPKEWEIYWPELSRMNDNERATIAVKWATLNKQAGEVVVRGAEIRDRILELEPLTDEEEFDSMPRVGEEEEDDELDVRVAASRRGKASPRMLRGMGSTSLRSLIDIKRRLGD